MLRPSARTKSGALNSPDAGGQPAAVFSEIEPVLPLDPAPVAPAPRTAANQHTPQRSRSWSRFVLKALANASPRRRQHYLTLVVLLSVAILLLFATSGVLPLSSSSRLAPRGQSNIYPAAQSNSPHSGALSGAKASTTTILRKSHRAQGSQKVSTAKTASSTGLRDSVTAEAAGVSKPTAMTAKGDSKQQHCAQVPRRVVVVGGGLAGLTAALTAAGDPNDNSNAVEVVVVEKMPKLGGNSMKASSGINALNPEGGDSEALFEGDTTTSGGGLSKQDLVHTLVVSRQAGSQAAIDFLKAQGADLGGITLLGGHSVPRTRTVISGANVGFVIMSALSTRVKAHMRITVMEGTRLTAIHPLGESTASTATTSAATTTTATASPSTSSAAGDGGYNNEDACYSYKVDLEGPASAAATAGAAASDSAVAAAAAGGGALTAPTTTMTTVPCNALVLATGGFAANKTLLQEVSPVAAELATTNGAWAQGDALPLARAVGAQLIHMDQVQVHPTGFMDPSDPSASTKFLAPEKLRGVGGLLLHPVTGRRVVNELGRRDHVSEALLALPGKEAWLLMGPEAVQQYGAPAIDFYCKKGLMIKVEGVAAAGAHMRVSADALEVELTEYAHIAATAAAAAPPAASSHAAGGAAETSAGSAGEGSTAGGPGSAPATGAVAAAVVARPKDAWGKSKFPNPPSPSGPLYLARVCPVVHYCMGGVEVDAQARVVGAGGVPLPGLYAAGEVSGGLHGRNRLGGNSLLECVVFGRVAGKQAADYATAGLTPAAVASL